MVERIFLVLSSLFLSFLVIHYYSGMVLNDYRAFKLKVVVETARKVSNSDNVSQVLSQLSPLILRLIPDIEKGRGYWKELHSVYFDMATASFLMGRNSISLKYLGAILRKYHPYSSKSFEMMAMLWRRFGNYKRADSCSEISLKILHNRALDHKALGLCIEGK